MTMGERIQQLRTAKGYTQEYIAGQMNISRQAVYKWEKNESRPDTDNLIMLADILGTTVEYIAVGYSSSEKDGTQTGRKKKLPGIWGYVITAAVTAIITFIITVLYIANAPVSFDAGACGGGFATAVYDQYARKLIEDNYFYLTRDRENSGVKVKRITPIRESRDLHYEGKAIYLSFDARYEYEDGSTDAAVLRFMGERKWIQVYEWQLIDCAITSHTAV